MHNNRTCRVCHQTLTLDNIYPSNIDKNNWICKACSNKKTIKRRNKLSNKPKSTQQILKDIVVNRGSIANHTRGSDKVGDPKYNQELCVTCRAYESTTSTCHLNPPMINGFPHVSPNEYCMDYHPTNNVQYT